MEIERTWLWGGGGLVVGLLLGIAIGGDGREERAAGLKQQEEISRNLASVSERVGQLDQELGTIGSAVAGLEGKVAAVTEQQEVSLTGLATRLDGVGKDLSVAVAGLGQEVSKSVGDRLEALRANLRDLKAQAGQELDRRAAGHQRDKAEDTPVASAASAPAGEGLAVDIGRVVVFGDGAARVFLSGIDPQSGSARIALNGPGTSTVELGVPVTAGACEITLTGFTESGGATFSGACGTDAPASAASPAAASSPAPAPTAVPAGAGDGTAIAVGSTAVLVEGKLRVFVSGTDPAAKTARIAVNGVETTMLPVGEPTAFGGCTLTLTGVEDGAATLSGGC